MKERYVVLMADDSEDDRLLMRIILRNHPKLILAGEVFSGEQVQAYLSGNGIYTNRQKYPFPDLLLLDLKMPGLSGFGVLDWLRAQAFPDLKVVVLSDLALEEQHTHSEKLGAHIYRTKPSSGAEGQQILRDLEELLAGSNGFAMTSEE
jgi:CheY-like chemotaxis protein